MRETYQLSTTHVIPAKAGIHPAASTTHPQRCLHKHIEPSESHLTKQNSCTTLGL